MNDNTKSKIYGSSKTEAWSDAESFDEDTHVNVPHQEAVENAKDWVDDNEL
jgi:hypothetical protein